MPSYRFHHSYPDCFVLERRIFCSGIFWIISDSSRRFCAVSLAYLYPEAWTFLLIFPIHSRLANMISVSRKRIRPALCMCTHCCLSFILYFRMPSDKHELGVFPFIESFPWSAVSSVSKNVKFCKIFVSFIFLNMERMLLCVKLNFV